MFPNSFRNTCEKEGTKMNHLSTYLFTPSTHPHFLPIISFFSIIPFHISNHNPISRNTQDSIVSPKIFLQCGELIAWHCFVRSSPYQNSICMGFDWGWLILEQINIHSFFNLFVCLFVEKKWGRGSDREGVAVGACC